VRRLLAACLVAGAAIILLGPAALAASPEDLEIDRVEISGVTLFDRAAVEGALEITAGDRLARSKVVRSAENFQALYAVRGYERVEVKSELVRQKGEGNRFENVLKFTVVEGLPTRVAAIRFDTGEFKDSSFGRYWADLRTGLEGKIGIRPGDVLDQERASLSKRFVQDALASEEFIGARVEDARVTGASPPTNELASQPAARWVELVYRIDLGDRVSFGFRGNSLFTRGRLLGLIDEQRLVGFGRDYVEAIRARIEEEYRSSGYPQTRVRAYTFERPEKQERHVTYEIAESRRVRIDSIEFEGNLMFKADRLRSEFFARASRLVQQSIYVEKDVEHAAELLVEWMRSQGYLAAKLITVNRAFVKEGSAVRLTLYLYEGDQTIVNQLVFERFGVIPKDELEHLLGVRQGEPLNLFQFNEGLEALKTAYRDRGYLDFRIANEGGENVVEYSQENRLATIRLEAVEGPQFRLSRVEVEGLANVKEDVVRREILIREGEVLEERRLAESEGQLRKLGIFSVVTTRLLDDPDRSGYKILRVSVQEGTPGLIAFGVGYRNDLGLRAFGQTAYTNVARRNHTISLTGSTNYRFDQSFCDNFSDERPTPPGQNFCFPEYQLAVGYIWPWAIFGDTTFRPQFSIERTQYRILDAFTVGLSLTLERKLLRQAALTGLLTYALERTNQRNAKDELDNRDLTIGSITPGLVLDLRDNSLAPTRGFFATSSLEFSSPGLLSQTGPPPVGYYRFQYRMDQFIPLGPDASFYLSFRTGYERNNELPPDGSRDPTYSIPLIKQFALGGAGSIRGFQEQELNARDTAIVGSLAYVNYRFQLDLPFSGPLKWGPFLDAGNLLVDRYSLGILRYGAGFGFRYKSPVGPVNFDWGFKLNHTPQDRDSNVFHFSIGVI
jgi:outer membrane protein insertion porin family